MSKVGALLPKIFKVAAFSLAVAQLIAPTGATALSPEQVRLYQSGVYYFDDQVTATAPATCTPVKPGGASDDGKPVYMVGDSIGTQVQATLPSALTGRQVKINAVPSRTLSFEPPSSGMSAITTDQEYIKSASVVIVQLGTNSNGFTAEAVGKMVSKIRELSPSAIIYWVDTAGVNQPIATTLSNVNSIIYSQASTLNYQVISWNKKVFGDQADPNNIDPNAADNGYIRRADQFVHLTNPAGVEAMTDLIATSVKNGPPAGANGCACTLLAGSDNIEKIWNFFAQKNLTPPVIAGIMGNMNAESGFEPRKVQYGTTNSRGEVSRVGQPSSLDDTPAAGGYGIVQWTPGTKIMQAAQQQNKSPSDLGFQLDLLWGQLTGTAPGEYISEKSAGDAVFAATTVEEATSAFMLKFERPLDQSPAAQAKRLNLFAIPILTKYGSGSPGSASTGTSSC